MPTAATRPRGASNLEVLLVVGLIAVLVIVAFRHIWALRVDAERLAVDQTVADVRSALGFAVMHDVVQGRFDDVVKLAGSNPVALLKQPPKGYLGALDHPDPNAVSGGHWYFDRGRGMLVYRVIFGDHFLTALRGPARAEFTIRVDYTDTNDNGRYDPDVDRINGVSFVPVDTFRWVD